MTTSRTAANGTPTPADPTEPDERAGSAESDESVETGVSGGEPVGTDGTGPAGHAGEIGGTATTAAAARGAGQPVPEPGTEADVPDGGATGKVEPTGAEVEAGGSAGGTATAGASAGRTRALRADEVAALEEQRDFLLRSLEDLEQEHDAGDVDEHDYTALRDDYTARAARVIRALDAHQARVAAPRRSQSRWRMLVTVAGVVVFALGAGVLVAQAAGRRQSGDSVTGNIRESARQQIDDAIGVAAEGDYAGAIDQLDAVLDDDPDDVEAMTWKGWFQYRSGDGESVVTLTDAVEADPEFPLPHAFLAVILRDLGRPDYALRELDRLDELDPPAEVAEMVAGLRDELEATLSSTTPTTSTTSTTAPTG